MRELHRKNGLRRVIASIGMASAIALSWVTLASAQAPITDDQARRIALEHVPGTVLDLEREDGEIEVEVRGEDGRVHEVKIDARDGRVIEVEQEDDDHDEGEGEDD